SHGSIFPRRAARRPPLHRTARSATSRATFSAYDVECNTMDRPTHAGLRHLALNVRDIGAMKRFYVDLLGFAVEWEPDPDNIYLSSGIDNLALHRAPGAAAGGRIAAMRGAAPAGDSGSAPSVLDHLGLIVRSAGDVDRWAAFLESRGVEL